MLYRWLIFLVLFVACARQQPPKEALAEYHYYPMVNAYHAVDSNRFIYSVDGGRHWLYMPADNLDTNALGLYSVLFAKDSIWLDNEVHRLNYGGVVIDAVGADTTGPPANARVTNKPRVTAKDTATTPQQTEEKKKKWLGRFLKSVFGGKKKDER